MTNPYRAMCAELADALAEWRLGGGPPEDTADADLLARARALLAQPAAKRPTDEELDSVMFQAVWECMDKASDLTNDEMDLLKARAVLARFGRPTPQLVADGREPASVATQPSDGEVAELVAELNRICFDVAAWDADAITRAADLLAQRHPAPVPVLPDALAEHTENDPSQISDGFHTFAELYEHRHALTLSLMKAKPELFWFSRRHNDGELCFGTGDWFIIGAELPVAGSITYHLPMALWESAQRSGAAMLKIGRPWDGHTPGDVVERLKAWAALAEPEPGEVPRIGHILRLAEIIREVDGRRKGAAALAEAILSHPGICSAGLTALDEAQLSAPAHALPTPEAL